ncbi:MAG: thioredoxin family protein [Chitinophagaceae bacterium]|nr:MAG: thioredoxin family protein [Chitinophagaceae bacterium]
MKLLKNIKLLLVVLLCSGSSLAQNRGVLISEADSLMSKQAKPLLILLSTDWCMYCRMQKNQLRENKAFTKRANDFYYIDFDAENKESIKFHGQEYHFKPNGPSTGVHGLATALSGPEPIAFPTWVLLDKDYHVLFRYRGVLTPAQLSKLMQTIEEINKMKR